MQLIEPRVLGTVRRQWIPLSYAAVCLDEEVVFDVRNGVCPTCSRSASWVLLSRWLTRKESNG